MELHQVLPVSSSSHLIHSALKNLCLGYFEFHKSKKSEFYRAARNNLAELWLEMELEVKAMEQDQTTVQLKTFQLQLVTQILPGFSRVLWIALNDALEAERCNV